jgi:hypothetical protein
VTDAPPGDGLRAGLPHARGPLSERVLGALRQVPHELGAVALPPDDPLGGEDLHLTLYVLYELHYRGFPEVDDEWEWEASLLALRRRLERRFEAALRQAVPFERVNPRAVPERLAEILRGADGPPLSRYLERTAGVDQFREFLIHRSAYQLKENEPHALAIARLDGRPKVALAEIQSDEFGGGRPERLHAGLFRKTMRQLGLDDRHNAYLDRIPGHTLATVNLMSLCGLHRRLRGAIVGHLAILEMDSSVPNRRYGDGLRRLGFDADVTDFFDEHVEADAVHEAIAANDLAGSLARQAPDTASDILFGAHALLLLDGAMARRILSDWSAARSSLRGPTL